ncbi:MAG: hypothetical protein M1837_003925 [Sclerophora amabilis]|nr:MAG: hypothetical protein M1837_003925 [Sclerophora amabilis]
MSSYSDFYRPASLAVDTKPQKVFDDEESSVLDEGILDGSVDSADIFSPKNGEWNDFDQDVISASTSSTNPFFRHHSNPYAYDPQVKSWDSGSCTPTAVYDGFPAEFEATAPAPYGAGTRPFEIRTANEARNAPPFPSDQSPRASLPPSPESNKDWVASLSSDQLEPRSIPKRMRPGSPMQTHSSLLRRDGIRKKNARFEIPAERNLLNIDQLIAHSADDQEIKELKQQKRLLRNRQAALDSRQRKKQHTERLEEEKKQYTTIITELEERLAQLEVRESEHLRRENEWKATQQRYEHYMEGLHMEKEEMVRRHTLESGDLRKKNAILTEHVQNLQKMDSTAMSAVPSSSGFSADFSDIDSLVMEGNSWDNFSFINDFAVDNDVKPENALVVPPKRTEKVAVSEQEKPAASSLLLILLLCGAFVASKSSTTSTPSIPLMPDDIRAASATVLDNIFKDAGVPHADPRLSDVNRVEALEPSPSEAAWPAASKTAFPTAAANSPMVGLSGSSFDVLNHHLVRPTKEQEQERLFSLSADQYNGVTSQEFLRQPDASGSASQGRRDLGASLAAMRADNKASAAEVYTRSLLWDKIPTEVVREFAKFVSNSNVQSSAPDEEDGT